MFAVNSFGNAFSLSKNINYQRILNCCDKLCLDYLNSISKYVEYFLFNLNKQQRQQKDLSTLECVENFHKSSLYKSKVSIGLC